jgi:hypothetical protein
MAAFTCLQSRSSWLVRMVQPASVRWVAQQAWTGNRATGTVSVGMLRGSTSIGVLPGWSVVPRNSSSYRGACRRSSALDQPTSQSISGSKQIPAYQGILVHYRTGPYNRRRC